MADNNFYKKATPSTDFYSVSSSGDTEPNMRQEFYNTIFGSHPEIAKGQYYLLRAIRKDSSGAKIACPCRDSLTKESSKDRFCPICYGEGYLFDETAIYGYKVLGGAASNLTKDVLIPPGLTNIPLVVFYIRYSTLPTIDDKIVVVNLDTDGSVEQPITRKEIYRINTSWEYRSDNGKLEYYKVYTHKEDVKHLNFPDYSDV